MVHTTDVDKYWSVELLLMLLIFFIIEWLLSVLKWFCSSFLGGDIWL